MRHPGTRSTERASMNNLSYPWLRGVRDLGPTLARVVVGAVMLAHGWQKITNGVDGFAGFVDQLGIPAPTFMAYLVTGLELIGGALLIVGLLSRVTATLLAVQMLFTAFLVKVANLGVPFIGSEGTGWELDITLFAAFGAIVLLGPGLFALDSVVGIEERRAARASRRPGGVVQPA